MNTPSRSPRPWLCALVFVAFLCAGCQVHSHRVGGGATGVGEDSTRQYYIFFGLLQLNEVNVQRMAGDLSSYDIRTKFSLIDFVLSPVLLPLTVTSRTVTVAR